VSAQLSCPLTLLDGTYVGSDEYELRSASAHSEQQEQQRTADSISDALSPVSLHAAEREQRSSSVCDLS